ncbi:MAG: Transcription factor zinc-finger [Myxococcales bacterium]|nr:Transcription factor zinc-finger [Myxococcales bacterium]
MGTRLGCEQCEGMFVRTKEVEEMLRQMSADETRQLGEIVTPGGDSPRPCPRCDTPMLVGALDGVMIDRCAEHGIWFDAAELKRVMENEHNRAEPRTASSSGVWRDLGSLLRPR